jgi:hypothetical protein
MVTLLTADLADPNGALVRVFPDLSFTGGVDDTFIVPEGKVFVITDIEVELYGTSAKAGFTAGATLVVAYPAGVGRTGPGPYQCSFERSGLFARRMSRGRCTATMRPSMGAD